MIFRVAASVLMYEPGPFRRFESGPREDASGFDAYKVVLGINAKDVIAAVTLAATALANATDEDGERLVGGVVLEVHAVLVASGEFEGYDKYFLQPMSLPGIFYASGRTLYSIASPLLAGASEAILSLEEGRITTATTAPSFVFRRFHEEEGPRNCRLVCPVCGRWKEHDSSNLMYSFFDGLGDLDEEKFRLGREAVARISPFVEQHLQCLTDAGPTVARTGLLFLYEGDEGINDLDPNKEDKT